MYVKKTKGIYKHIDFIIADIIVLELSLVLAYFLRFGFENPFKNNLFNLSAISLPFLDLAVISFGSVYSGILKRGYAKEFRRVILQAATLLVISAFILYVSKIGSQYSRLFMAYTAGIYFFLEYLVRIVMKRLLSEKGFSAGQSSFLVATTKELADTVAEDISVAVDPGIFISGFAILDADEEEEGNAIGNYKVVATKDSFMNYVTRSWLDEILFVLPMGGNAKYSDMIDEISHSGITTHVSLGKAQSTIGHKQRIENVEGYTVLTTSINQLTFRQVFIKRVMDIIGGFFGSIIALIAILIIGPIIFIKSPGPILFKQKRVGRNGKTFNFLKIRSMIMNADEKKAELMAQNRVKDGMMFKLEDDPRIIGSKILPDGKYKKGIGNFIRDWSIDELPQFFNVLKGDMSLVGTRPPTMDEWNKYKLHHRARLAFKPGITGLWQVSGRSQITDFEEVVKLDTQYIMDWSFGLDIRIMLKTVKAVLKREGSM